MVKTFLLNKSTYPALDGLRGIAIIMVFNIHFLGYFDPKNYFLPKNSILQYILDVLHSGHLGVDLFFVLSGFLIFRSLLKSNPTPMQFIKKRISRLFPAHFFVLLILSYPTFELLKFILNLFLVPGLSHVVNYNDVTWSLSWEMLFYFIVFVLFIINKKLNGKYFWELLFITSIFLLFIFSPFQGATSKILLPTWGRFMSFFFGVIIAYLEKIDFKLIKTHESIIKILSFLAIVVIIICSLLWRFYIGLFESTLNLNLFYLAVGISFFLITLRLIVFKGLLNRILEFPIIRFLGQISYSFYLCHVPIIYIFVITVISEAHSFGKMVFEYITIFGICAALASFMYYYLERPYFINKSK